MFSIKRLHIYNYRQTLAHSESWYSSLKSQEMRLKYIYFFKNHLAKTENGDFFLMKTLLLGSLHAG